MWIPRLTGLCVVVLTSVGLRVTLVPTTAPVTANQGASLVVNYGAMETDSACPWGDRTTQNPSIQNPSIQKLEGYPGCGDRPWPHSLYPDVITQ